MTLDTGSRRIGFIGAGTLGSGLALALYRKGYNVRAVSSRTRQSAETLADFIAGCDALDSPQDVVDAADLVFITTPDSAITPVAASVRWQPGQEVAHCCGASGRALLQPAADQGAEAGAFHPFQTFAGIATPDHAVARLTGVTFAISADGALAEFLAAMTANLGGRAVALEDNHRALYHSAGILSCGYLVTLLQTALGALEDSGFSREEALGAVVSLARTTLDNVALLGPAASVTGPLVRGDAGTVRKHLAALERNNPPMAALYGALTELSFPIARQRGLGPEGEAAIRQAVAEAGSHHPPVKR
jgi:predicted short-subunit dehydrogenase-like oxidoreductase (DUF2520 family)